MIDPFTGASAVARFFLSVGKFIGQAGAFLAKPAVQLGLMVAQGVMSHQAAMKAKRTGADILLQKYGTGGGIPVIYGTRRVAGTVVYMETQNNRELYVVYAIAAHEIDSFDLESIQLDGRTVKDTNIYRQGYDISDGTTRINFRPSSVTRASGTFWGNTPDERTNITDPANTGDNARMTFNCHKGTTTQAADPMLEGILTNWTSSHKLTGIAYIAANYEYDTQGMFTGIPNLTIVVNGKKVFDPRDTGQTFGTESTYTHSSNAALCLLDYITNDDYGKGLGTSDLESDFASWKTAADDCDTSVDTIDHTGISVESASTDSDVMIIASASQAKFNKLKVGNKYTVDDGTTTYVNSKKLIDKDSTQIDLDGSNPFAILKLKFEDGAIDNAITSSTSCDFAETQIRFDCNGVLDTEETVLENTKLLIANMRGIFTYANGKYQVKVEGTESSVVTLDEDDILESGITLSLENKEAKYNKVEAEFYNAQKRYESDTTYYTGETADTFLADDGNEVLETRIQLPFCTNQRIAYNHAKGLLKRSRKQKTISFVATPKVLKAKVGEVITVSNTNLNLSSELYRITNMTINPDLNIAVTAIEYQTDVYGYVAPPDEDIDIPDDPPEGNRVVAPTNLTFTNKNATTGEAAKLTWTDSTKYPSYEFRVRIIDGLKTRYDKRVKDTYFYLDGISVKNGYEARVSAINALGVESDSTNITVNVTTEPITTPDIKQGSIGGFSFTDSKMYHPVDGSDTGVFETSNVYIDDSGQFSLKDKLSFDGTTLDISGNLTVENTITADKIVLDGINLDNLISASTQSGSIYLTEFTGIKVATAGATNGYPALVKLQDDQVTNGFTDILQFSNNLVFRTHGNTTKGAMRFEGRQGTTATPVVYGGFDSDGNFHINYTDVISSSRQLQNIASLDATTTSTIQSAVSGGSTTTINNNADNRVITGSNTADTLNGESNLTFDGSTLGVTGTISSGAITSSGNLHAGDGTDISMDASANGQIEVDGNGYQGAIALDASAMHLYHNSSSRSLVLGTNETARLTIGGTGGFNFHSNNLSSVGTISSGAITADSTGTNTVTIDGTGSFTLRSYHDSGGVGWATGSGASWNNLLYLDDSNDFVRIYSGQAERARFNSSGIDARSGGFLVNGTTVIDSLRNLTNIGTYSGSGNMTITASTSPTLRIERSGASQLDLIASTASTGNVIDAQSGKLTVRTSTTKQIEFETNNIERMRITSGGDVGIGTTSPSTKLDIVGGTGNNFPVKFNGDNSSNNGYLYADSGGAGIFNGSTIAGSEGIYLHVTDSNLRFYTAGAERIRVDSAGSMDFTRQSSTGANSIHLPRAGGITFYGDTSEHHGIFSRSQNNVEADDILITSYGAVYIDLDSNNNNGSSADFVIGRHNSTSLNLFSVSGETGAVIASDNITAYGSPSDLRLKENIEIITNPIEKVKQLKGITFNYKKDGGRSTGLIAQDLEKVLPEVVYETHDINDTENKFKAVRYGNVVGLLVEAIKELKAEIEELKK